MDLTADRRTTAEDINVSVFTGCLARSPELYLIAGVPVCDLLINCSRTRTHDGHLVKKTSSIPVKVVGPDAERCCQTLRKGFRVTVHGELDSYVHQAPDGRRRSGVRVITQEIPARSEPKPTGDDGPRQRRSPSIRPTRRLSVPIDATPSTPAAPAGQHR
jgi:single-stranded DNA-binding protein